MEQPIFATPPGRRKGVMLRAAVGYAAILAILFYRLFLGQVLSPAAIAGYYPPFDTSRHDALLYSDPFQWDVWTQIVPWEYQQYRHEEGLPQWDPHIYCGFPVFANGQSEFLNPTHWIYYLVNPDLARGPMAALRLWVSAMAMFMLLCRWRVGAGGAFLGGAIWVLSAFNIRWLLWSHTDASLTIPIILLALDCYIAGPTVRRWALAALVGALLALSGHVAMELMVGIVVGIFLVVRLIAQRGEGVSWPALALRGLACGAALFTAFLAAAAQVIPQLMQILGSYELAKGDRGTFAFPFHALGLFLSPNIDGWTRGEHHYDGPSNYLEAACWFGLVALGLAGAGAAWWFREEFRIGDLGSRIWKRSPASRDHPRNSDAPRWIGGFAIVLIVICFVLAMGVPVYFPAFRANKVIRNINFIRLFLGVHFGGAILAAIAADRIFRFRSRATALVTLLLCGSAVICVMVLFWRSPQRQFLDEVDFHQWSMALLDSSVRVAGGLAIGLAACVALGAICWSMRGGRSLAKWGRFALIAIGVADLLWVAWDFNSSTPRDLLMLPLPRPLPQLISSAGAGRIMATIWVLTPNQATMYGFRDPRGYDLPKSFRLGNLLEKLGLDPLYGTPSATTRVAPVMDAGLAAWLDRCSVRYLLLTEHVDRLNIAGASGNPAAPPSDPLVAGSQPWPLVASLPRTYVYANPNAYPRAFMAAQAVRGTADDALNIMLDPRADLRINSIYESPVPERSAPPSGPASGTVRIARDSDQEVDLDVSTATGGVVVLQDRMAPGWMVTVDGSPGVALTTNYVFRGVRVGAGQHTVRWSYQTPGLMTGGVISFVTLLALLGAAANLPLSSPRKGEGELAAPLS